MTEEFQRREGAFLTISWGFSLLREVAAEKEIELSEEQVKELASELKWSIREAAMEAAYYVMQDLIKKKV